MDFWNFKNTFILYHKLIKLCLCGVNQTEPKSKPDKSKQEIKELIFKFQEEQTEVCYCTKNGGKLRLFMKVIILSTHYREHINLTHVCMYTLEGTGAYGPLLLAPAEGLGDPLSPISSGVIYFKNYFSQEKSIDI